MTSRQISFELLQETEPEDCVRLERHLKAAVYDEAVQKVLTEQTKVLLQATLTDNIGLETMMLSGSDLAVK